MSKVVFISDLHLHPAEQNIQDRFNIFIEWAKQSATQLYILGDFFHAWIGDDGLDEWSLTIANQIRSLVDKGIPVFYMHGNRDFLIGKKFSRLAGWKLLTEPTLLELGSEKVLLAHGDAYCTKDKDHQRFRILTRNRIFCSLFVCLPLKLRKKLVDQVRQHSMSNTSKTLEQMDVVAETVIKVMKDHKINTLIHGHTHKSGLTNYELNGVKLQRYVLSDWDDNPQILCYDNTMGLHFTQL